MVHFVDKDSVTYADTKPIYYPGDRVTAFASTGTFVQYVGDTHAEIHFDKRLSSEVITLTRVQRV